MTYDVRPSATLFLVLDEDIPDEHYLRIFVELSEVCLRLLDEGPDLDEARPIQWPIGETKPWGLAIDLRGEDGFVVYFAPEALGHDYVYVAALKMYKSFWAQVGREPYWGG